MQQWQQMVTFGLAMLGAVLGVINTWRAINRDRLKLRVRFVHGFPVNQPHMPEQLYGVEVTNLSTFPVTISEVGLDIRGESERAAFIPHVMRDGGDPLPRRLESREQIAVYISSEHLRRDVAYSHVYAITACDCTVRGRMTGYLAKKQ